MIAIVDRPHGRIGYDEAMRRLASLEIMFATLIAGCGPEKASSSGSSDASDSNDSVMDSSCDTIRRTSTVEVSLSRLEGAVAGDGMIDGQLCQELCTEDEHNYSFVDSCYVLEMAMLMGDVADTGGFETDPGPMTTHGPGDSGSGGSGDTTGDVSETTGTTTGDEETVVIECVSYQGCLGGRGHACLRPRPPVATRDRIAAWLAATAHDEAASVISFDLLAEELREHGAPAELIERCRRAAADEVRHARVMARLAHRRGHAPARPSFEPARTRDLVALAIENAVEGCVRETWAALEAAHQARHAGDHGLRRAMTRIAADEAGHAELAHDLDAWLASRLDAAARNRVAEARAQAIARLEHEVGMGRDADFCERTGLPSRATALRLVQGLREHVWQSHAA
jgi:rubrerythrin